MIAPIGCSTITPDAIYAKSDHWFGLLNVPFLRPSPCCASHRLVHSGSLRSEWGTSENNRRARYYSITAAGRKQLAAEEAGWAKLTEAVARVLRHA